MTTNETIQIQHTDGAPLAPDDVRVAMARALQTARAIIARIDGEDAELPTPCDGWTTGDVARHLITVFRKAAVAPSGADLMDFPEIPDIPLDAMSAELERSAADMHAAWSDDALEMMIDAPWGTMPGAAVLGVWAVETLVHTWDLAVALGVEPTWPEPDTTIGLEQTMAAMPPSGRPEFVPFDDAVTIADERPSIDRLAAYMGRDVDAWR
ncbi:MAG: TIGR03086 family metal-binding protein [Ilumatobacter sp.]